MYYIMCFSTLYVIILFQPTDPRRFLRFKVWRRRFFYLFFFIANFSQEVSPVQWSTRRERERDDDAVDALVSPKTDKLNTRDGWERRATRWK